MAWRKFLTYARHLSLLGGIAVLALAVHWLLKIREIQHLRLEISQVETRLGQGQELWRSYPPLSPEQSKSLHESRQRLFRMLPKDKDIPSLLQEISRLAQEYSVTNLSFNTADGASSPPAGQPAPAVVPQPQAAGAGKSDAVGPIASFPVKVGFAGDYRGIAYFLEALQQSPRLITVQSIQLQRSAPLVAGEVTVHAYYQKGNLQEQSK
jgi:Tfp pilus assembly protein PilO